MELTTGKAITDALLGATVTGIDFEDDYCVLHLDSGDGEVRVWGDSPTFYRDDPAEPHHREQFAEIAKDADRIVPDRSPGAIQGAEYAESQRETFTRLGDDPDYLVP